MYCTFFPEQDSIFVHQADNYCEKNAIHSSTRLELNEPLGPRLVQDAKAALPAADGIAPLDDVSGAAITAPVLDAAEDGHGRGGAAGTLRAGRYRGFGIEGGHDNY